MMHVKFSNYEGDVHYKLWKSGDAFPEFSSEVGIDTETELITDVDLSPPLVVMGVYNPKDDTTYISDYHCAHEFLQHITQRDIKMYFANAGFDYFVLGEKYLQYSVEAGKLIDILCRGPLADVATVGFVRTYSLEDACKWYLRYAIDKHKDEGDQSVRLNFRRDEPCSDEACTYLAIDCMTTYYAAKAMKPRPTEVANTKGSIALYHISKNGFLVDMPVFEYFYNILRTQKEKYRQELISYGFPDPEAKNGPSDTEKLAQQWKDYWPKWAYSHMTALKQTLSTAVPSKNTCKRMFLYCWTGIQSRMLKEQVGMYVIVAFCEDKKTLSVREKKAMEELIEELELEPYDISGKSTVWPTLLLELLKAESEDKTEEQCKEIISNCCMEHTEWICKEEKKGPNAFLQEHLQKLEDEYHVGFAKTEKTGKLKCSKKDEWMLVEKGVKDPFLTSHINYVHNQKYLSTYCNRAYIRSDGKMRTRFGIVDTCRTSSGACSG